MERKCKVSRKICTYPDDDCEDCPIFLRAQSDWEFDPEDWREDHEEYEETDRGF